MPRTKRAQRFLFDPDKFYHDPAVQKMSLPARGAHAMLVCASWHQKVPGVFVADDRILASLAMCTPDEWRQVKSEVQEAFTVTRDTWELSGVTQVKIEQDKKRDAWVNRKQRQRLRERDMAVTSRVGSGSGSGAGSGTEKEEPKPTSIGRPSDSLFDEFWSESPKKVGKKPAHAKWKRLVNGSETLGREIIAGLRRLKPTWNQGYEPNPLTFLNQERWKDEPAKAVDDGWTVTPTTKHVCVTCEKPFEVRGTWRDHDCPDCKSKRPPLNVLPWSERHGAR